MHRALVQLLLFNLLAGCRACEEPPSRALSAPARRWHAAGFSGGGSFLGVHPDPRRPGVVYATTDRSGVFRSEDSGGRWEPRSRGLGNLEVASFAIDPFSSEILYAGVGGTRASGAGLHLSRDSGLSWQRLASSSGIQFLRHRGPAIAPDPTRRGVLLVGSAGGGLFRSSDGGKSWTLVLEARRSAAPEREGEEEPPPEPLVAVPAVVWDPTRKDVVFAALEGIGVARSGAGGVAGSWRVSNRGLPRHPAVRMIAVARSGTVLAALVPSGVFRSADGGATWRSASDGLPLDRGSVSWLAVDPVRPARVYAALAIREAPGIWQSEDEAGSWAPLSERVSADRHQDPTREWATGTRAIAGVAVDPREPRRLLGASEWGVLRSENGGRRWRDAVTGAQTSCTSAIALDGDRLLAAHLGAGLLASRDGGASWRAVWPSQDGSLEGNSHQLAVAQLGRGRVLLAGFEPRSQRKAWLLRSSDGRRWEIALELERSKGSWTDGAITGLAVDPRDARRLYLAQDGGAVLVSHDAGASWRPTQGQPGGRSFTQALAVGAKGELLAGTYRDGLWRSPDGGKRWQRVLLEQHRVWQLAHGGKAIFATSGTDGNLHRSQDGGMTWRAISRPASAPKGEVEAIAIAVDPRDPRHLVFSRLAGTHPADAGPGLLESHDGGESWREANDDLPVPSVTTLFFDGEGALFAGTRCVGIWRRQP